jgi:adenylylsulfate kinase
MMESPLQPTVVWHQESVTQVMREAAQGHRAGVLWLTGLSGSGKSSLANALDQRLFSRGIRTFLLDGDNVRHGLCATPAMLEPLHGQAFAERFGLGFSPQDREENIRRVGTAAELLVAAGLLVITAFVSPYRRDRDRVRQRIEAMRQAPDFLEVFVDTPLEVCEQRDPKGLYRLARQGKIAHFTGISDPYEPPLTPELRLDGSAGSPEQLAQQTLGLLEAKGWVKR